MIRCPLCRAGTLSHNKNGNIIQCSQCLHFFYYHGGSSYNRVIDDDFFYSYSEDMVYHMIKDDDGKLRYTGKAFGIEFTS